MAEGGVRALVRAAWRSLVAVRATESVLVGAAAGAVTACAVALEGRAGAGLEGAWTALLGGLAGGGAYWLSHRVALPDVARLVDGRLDLRGALVTAYDAEGRAPTGRLAPLLSRRVLARVSAGGARRAIAPSSAFPIAAPFLAFALLALANEHRRGRVALDLERLVDGLAEELAVSAPGEGDGGQGAASEAEWRALEREVRALRAELASDEGDPLELDASLAALDRELSERAGEAVADPELAAAVERGRAWVDAARRRLAAGGDEWPPAHPGGDGGASASGGDDAAGSGAAPAPGAEVPDASPGAQGSPGADSPGSVRPEAAGGVPRWWPERHDALVRAWVEARRAPGGAAGR